MQSTSHAFKDDARAELANQTLQKAMRHVKTGVIDKRAKARSGERRGEKECGGTSRSRGSPYDEKKKEYTGPRDIRRNRNSNISKSYMQTHDAVSCSS